MPASRVGILLAGGDFLSVFSSDLASVFESIFSSDIYKLVSLVIICSVANYSLFVNLVFLVRKW